MRTETDQARHLSRPKLASLRRALAPAGSLRLSGELRRPVRGPIDDRQKPPLGNSAPFEVSAETAAVGTWIAVDARQVKDIAHFSIDVELQRSHQSIPQWHRRARASRPRSERHAVVVQREPTEVFLTKADAVPQSTVQDPRWRGPAQLRRGRDGQRSQRHEQAMKQQDIDDIPGLPQRCRSHEFFGSLRSAGCESSDRTPGRSRRKKSAPDRPRSTRRECCLPAATLGLDDEPVELVANLDGQSRRP